MQYPGGRPTTKTLNTGNTTTVPAATILGVNFYASAPGTTTPLYRLNGATPAGAGTFTFTSIPSVPGIPTQPVTNTAGIEAPTVPLTDSAVAGGTIPVGTSTVGYTFVTPIGETTLSPSNTVTFTSGFQSLQVVSNTAANSQANTGYVTVELFVPNLEDWHVTRYAVYVSAAVHNVPSVNLYLDSVALINLLDTTALGAQNSANADLWLRPGQRMIAQWFGADAGAMATLSVFGEKVS